MTLSSAGVPRIVRSDSPTRSRSLCDRRSTAGIRSSAERAVSRRLASVVLFTNGHQARGKHEPGPERGNVARHYGFRTFALGNFSRPVFRQFIPYPGRGYRREASPVLGCAADCMRKQ